MRARPDHHQQAAADLCWLINRPPLARLGNPLPPWFMELSSLRCTFPRVAEALDTAKHLPLGRYAELLLADSIASHPAIAECHVNLVIRDQQRTLGEFDFLVRPRGERRFHLLELAVKFYLGLPACAATEGKAPYWLGLNPRDSLERKLARMSSHQLTLPDHPAARQQLLQAEIEIGARSGWVAGILFYPTTGEAPPLPESVTPDHQRGSWTRVSGWQSGGDHRHQPLDHRLHWLAGTGAAAPREYQELRTMAARKPLMLAQQADDNDPPTVSPTRLVVVPDHWPGTF